MTASGPKFTGAKAARVTQNPRNSISAVKAADCQASLSTTTIALLLQKVLSHVTTDLHKQESEQLWGTFLTNFGVLLQGVIEQGISSLAVCLKHSFLFPEHEQQVGQLATTMGFTQISLSSEVMPMVKMVPRGYTAAADAYLTPHIMR